MPAGCQPSGNAIARGSGLAPAAAGASAHSASAAITTLRMGRNLRGGGLHQLVDLLLLLRRGEPQPLDGLAQQTRDVHLGVAEAAADLGLRQLALVVEVDDRAVAL